MLLTISHTTRYRYDQPGSHAVQKLRLTPHDSNAQRVIKWTIDAPGIETAATHIDGFGNKVHLISQSEPHDELVITASGEVETFDTGGVSGPDQPQTNPRVFLNATRLTAESDSINDLADEVNASSSNPLDQLHTLMSRISEKVVYEPWTTHSNTTAAEAFDAGKGVCQDHAHILIAAARRLDIPARYATGYLHVEEEGTYVAHHAWSEAFLAELGWIGLDPANGVCPTEHYVRLSCGLDAVGASPITGVRKGSGIENLTVDVIVKQQQQ
jgi:transglutaminase-like putative cysteine protease